MTREILFRAKTKEGKWVYGDLVQYGQYKSIKTLPENFEKGVEHIVIPETVGQFTGLLDKNGRKIFEGDKVADSEETYIVVFGRCYGQEFNGIGWLLYNLDWSFFFSENDQNVIEVIGNIHDEVHEAHAHLLTNPD